ncbi:MAG: DUF4197 domain-containing protein [Sulfurimonas sp.]|nr:DUF4197 domain-containing protein [Sulfurimonas sp.]MDQ7060155.1 DUF4197 domain-containing protein [Sulfurimonas sp.]
MFKTKKTLLVTAILGGSLLFQGFGFNDMFDKVKDFSKFSKPGDLTPKEIMETMTGGVLSTDMITKAFKEALKIGVEKAVDTLGQEGGFLDNPATRIPLPAPFSTMETGIRAAGGGKMIDDFVRSMNRAAAKAAPQTAGIFVASIDKMSFNDAADILMMDGSPATDYFAEHTRVELKELIRPLVIEAMKENNVYKYYNALSKVANPGIKLFAKGANFMGMAEKLHMDKFVPEKGVNLDDYITQYTIDGIFLMIGMQERLIRTNPVHQTSARLRKVFGSVMP